MELLLGGSRCEVVLHVALEVEVAQFITLLYIEKCTQFLVREDFTTVLGVLKVMCNETRSHTRRLDFSGHLPPGGRVAITD